MIHDPQVYRVCRRLARDVWVRLLPPLTPQSLPPPLGHRGLGPGERNAPWLKPQVHCRVRPGQVLVQSVGSATIRLNWIHSQIKSLLTLFRGSPNWWDTHFVTGTNVLSTIFYWWLSVITPGLRAPPPFNRVMRANLNSNHCEYSTGVLQC